MQKTSRSCERHLEPGKLFSILHKLQPKVCLFVLWIVSCAGQDIALADAGSADWEIAVKSEVIHIKAGIIQRSIARKGTNIATTGLTVDGGELLAGPVQELSVTFFLID